MSVPPTSEPLTPEPLTPEDLEAIATAAMETRDPGPMRARLTDAVEQGHLADPADAAYALGLAAAIAETTNDLDVALGLAGRAVTAAEGTDEHDTRRAQHAGLLLRAGRVDEGLRELTALRPRLTRDPFAADQIVDALTTNGHAELAEQWLTPALATATDTARRATPDSDAADEAWEIADVLALRRREVRHDLGLPPDAADERADEIAAAYDGEPDLLFWPAAAFAELTATASADLAVLGDTWDEHRAIVERELAAGDAEGDPALVEVATPELLAAAVTGGDTDAVDRGPLLAWPPGRNEPCWCGSRTKYKKCCLPRGRG